MTNGQTPDPVSALLRAPGTPPRLVALVVSAVALVLPGIHNVMDDMEVTASLLDAVPLTVALPLVIAVALVASGVEPLSRYARLIDLVAAVVGAVLLVLLFMKLGEVAKITEQSRNMLQRYNQDGVWTTGLALGAWAMIGATAIIGLQVFLGVRR